MLAAQTSTRGAYATPVAQRAGTVSSRRAVRVHARPDPAASDADALAVSRRVGASMLASALVAGCTSMPADAATVSVSSASVAAVDTTMTNKVYIDVGMCPSSLRTDRKMGDKSALCSDSAPLGRIEIGLYGNYVPITVRNFMKLAESGSLVGTAFSKVFPGEYVLGGAAGSKRYGFIDATVWDLLEPNPEILSGSSFLLDHTRPGTVSLAIGVNPDDEAIKEQKGYRNTSFLITTGPGPDFDLDGTNVVFGRVTKGFDAIGQMAAVPTFSPAIKLKQLNKMAGVMGDERATKASKNWGKPQKALVITGAGVL